MVAGEMAQSTGLLHRNEALSLDPQHPHTIQALWCLSLTSGLGDAETGRLLTITFN